MIMTATKLLFACFIAFLSAFSANANNVTISNITMTNDSTITFDISWDNSWRVGVAPNNHDAVWLFIKKRDCASMIWSHVNLSPTVGNHSAASPLEVFIDGKDGVSAAKGVFLRRAANGTGNIASTSVSLRMIGLVAGQFDFQVFGIEMVQIPSGSFSVGDGAAAQTLREGSTTNPFLINSENAITAGAAAGQLNATTFPPLSIPASFPKGFNEVYAMKYEISQGQYVDFVNTLNSGQGAARQITSAANRMNITGTWPALVAGAPHRAMVFLAWADLLAYLDWAALRPMSELEFEKICRGPVFPNNNENAWGSALTIDANTAVNDGTATENVSNAIPAGNGIANYNNTTLLGPLRCGFAAKPGTNRQQAGASYYGVMELSGNANEQVVTTTNATGIAFQGNLGDGEISLTPTPGFADVANWPSVQANVGSGTSAVGRGLRGGNWATTITDLNVSDRSSITNNSGLRTNTAGGRGVR